MLPKDVEYVLAIAKQKSFSKAAECLYVAQPSLSRYISNLEKELGVQLFDRTTVPIELTYAGKRYISYANEYQDLMDKMKHEFNILQTYNQGKINLGIPSIIAIYILPRILVSFSKECPGIEVNITTDTTENLTKLLLENKLDLSVLCLPYEHTEYENAIIAYDKMLLVAPANHPVLRDFDLRDNRYDNPLVINLKKIEKEQFLLLNSGLFLHDKAKKIFQRSGIAPSRVIEVPSLTIAWNLACNGMGFTFILQSMAKNMAVKQKPIYCYTQVPEESIEIVLTYKRSNYLTNDNLRVFIDFCQQVYADHTL
jgi:DNA-binding transcriptional LysR family regulator